MFGRRNKRGADDAVVDELAVDGGVTDEDTVERRADGPFDSTEVDLTEGDLRLDLGSVRLPLPPGGQIQVEMEPTGALRSVHLVTPAGRLTVAAFAAPRSAGLWREVAGELAGQLRTDQAQVTIVDGPWGREVTGVSPTATLRFLGADGPRWMVRCVCAGPAENAEQLLESAREVLRGTVVVRGDEPMPVRTPLPVVLPAPVAAQLEAAKQQAAEQAAQRAAQQAVQQTAQQQGGQSAMQQLGRETPPASP